MRLLHTSPSCLVQRFRPARPRPRSFIVAMAGPGGARDPARQPRRENVAGKFYVDRTCIDCDTCRWMAKGMFTEVGGMSAVTRQPQTREEELACAQALLSCPTFSIHADGDASRSSKDLLQAAKESLPAPVPGVPGVFHTGYHTERSYAATPYLIQRPAGNILVDSPRFNPTLVKRIADMGGVKFMFLTHQDDVGDHEKWAEHFGAQRVMHERERQPRFQGIERWLTGTGPWEIDDEGDVVIVHTPGHTRGHCCLLFRPARALFTGDHLSLSEDERGLSIHRGFNWYSVPEQEASVRKLHELDFLHILPGHGRRVSFATVAERDEAMERVVESKWVA